MQYFYCLIINILDNFSESFLDLLQLAQAIVIDSISMNFYIGEFYQFNLSSCIRQQNSLTAQFVSFSLSNLANIFYPPNFYNN